MVCLLFVYLLAGRARAGLGHHCIHIVCIQRRIWENDFMVACRVSILCSQLLVDPPNHN